MTITVPYIFQAGTKAKAQEVNDNFTAIVTEVNSLSSDILENATDITTLRNTKADLNGNTNNRFSVANPVNSNDAVNKQTLISLTGYGLFGLQVTKSDETHISCTAGATWDTTQTKILSFSSTQAVAFTTGATNTTYYVYIIGTSDGLQTQLFISSSSDNPPLPEGYTLYKQLASLQTMYNSGNIDYIVDSTGYNPSLIQVAGSPDWGKGSGRAQGTYYTESTSGWIFGWRSAATNAWFSCTYRGATNTINLPANPNTQGWAFGFTFNVPRTATWYISNAASITWVPSIGG